MKLGDQIRVAREARGLTHEQVGELLKPKVSYQSVQYWERDKFVPRPDKLKQLEKIFATRFSLTDDDHLHSGAQMPPGVSAFHLKLAVQLSRLPELELQAFATLLGISAARAERKQIDGKPIDDFFVDLPARPATKPPPMEVQGAHAETTTKNRSASQPG